MAVPSKLVQFRTKAVEASKIIKQLKDTNQQQLESRLLQYRAKAGEASKLISDNGANYYKQLSSLNQKQVQERLLQIRAKAAETPKLISMNGASYYKQLLERNQQYVQDPPTPEMCQELEKHLLYTSLASIPYHYGLMRGEVDGLKQLLKNWKDLTPEHYGAFTLFGMECCAWAWAGKFIVGLIA